MYAYDSSVKNRHALILNYIFHSEMSIKFTICEHWPNCLIVIHHYAMYGFLLC